MTAQDAQTNALNSARMDLVRQTEVIMKRDIHSASFSPTLCVTHRCNLACSYCYQNNKDLSSMTFDVAIRCIDDIFSNIPAGTKIIEISFIGGEPLLESNLLKDVYCFTKKKYKDDRVKFFATTNGTTLTQDDKEWFFKHKHDFILGLSLDGTPQTHNMNRSNSYSKIDIPFFLHTWPEQGPKMTIAKDALGNLAADIIHIHELGFKYINGVNFAEGDFTWDTDDSLRILANQLRILLDYYTDHYDTNLDQMFGKRIEFCACDHADNHKPCGIGTRTRFYDVDGNRYPCSFVTPLTFSKSEIIEIAETDFDDISAMTDRYCEENCYLLPVCGTCLGANYLVNKAFNERIKTRCSMNRLICLYVAELHTRRILMHRELYKDENQLFFLIEAIKEIRTKYYPEFQHLLS